MAQSQTQDDNPAGRKANTYGNTLTTLPTAPATREGRSTLPPAQAAHGPSVHFRPNLDRPPPPRGRPTGPVSSENSSQPPASFPAPSHLGWPGWKAGSCAAPPARSPSSPRCRPPWLPPPAAAASGRPPYRPAGSSPPGAAATSQPDGAARQPPARPGRDGKGRPGRGAQRPAAALCNRCGPDGTARHGTAHRRHSRLATIGRPAGCPAPAYGVADRAEASPRNSVRRRPGQLRLGHNVRVAVARSHKRSTNAATAVLPCSRSTTCLPGTQP